jgi:H+-transporting ATPase
VSHTTPTDILTAFLQAMAVLAAGLASWVDFGILTALFFFVAALSYVHHRMINSIDETLNEAISCRTRVLREGRSQWIPVQDIVPGDLFYIRKVRLQT